MWEIEIVVLQKNTVCMKFGEKQTNKQAGWRNFFRSIYKASITLKEIQPMTVLENHSCTIENW